MIGEIKMGQNAVKNNERFHQGIIYDEIFGKFSKLCVSDIDGCFEYKNRVAALLEFKYQDAPLSIGQKRAYINIVNNLYKGTNFSPVVLIVRHNVKDCKKDVIGAECFVTEKYSPAWGDDFIKLKHPINLKEYLNKLKNKVDMFLQTEEKFGNSRLHYKTCDIINAKEDLILHQVNCLGVMGGGVAKSLREKYPEIYPLYKDFCDIAVSKENLLGKILFTPVIDQKDKRIIGNLFTQLDIKKNQNDNTVYTDYTALRKALKFINDNYSGASIAIPYFMGCGLANGNWDKVMSIIKEELINNFDIVIYDKFNQRLTFQPNMV